MTTQNSFTNCTAVPGALSETLADLVPDFDPDAVTDVQLFTCSLCGEKDFANRMLVAWSRDWFRRGVVRKFLLMHWPSDDIHCSGDATGSLQVSEFDYEDLPVVAANPRAFLNDFRAANVSFTDWALERLSEVKW
jgi:hypothetical protein